MGWNPNSWREYANYECAKAHVGNNGSMKIVQCYFRICCSSEKVKLPRCLIDFSARLFGEQECRQHMFQLYENLNPSNKIHKDNIDWQENLRDELFGIIYDKKGRRGKIIQGEYLQPLPQEIINYFIIGSLGLIFLLALIFRKIRTRKKKNLTFTRSVDDCLLDEKSSKDEKVLIS
ncbi:Oidioi.mRNA.OKI2018_I69.chr1.g2164.t1.cds [Oikopleura dioica]|uniref:Oidioi.mRNA.OKI2018_I69.chr1.g2164.t1.cds n=1 Tax=Oikopleura dioica TaxID=34765 RepID=A0ABN7SUH4_OIKDI|nr:Oidioi.mRNA.OKI2018_I69.chr1.g2164.t1.cds [Oikopleura dioica]